MIGQNQTQQVLFTRADLDAISERCATYIMQRCIDPTDAWKQAVEDQAELIEAKLELMEEGSLVWDSSSRQVKAAKWILSQQTKQKELVTT